MANEARAIVSHDMHTNDGWKLEEVSVRKPQKGELLVDMVASGICHTDVLLGGLPHEITPLIFYPRVLGHEGGGYVKEVGEGVTVAKPGDAVLLSYAYCGECDVCQSGHRSYCNEFDNLNFCERVPVFKPKSGGNDLYGCFFGQSSFASQSIVRQCSVVNVQGLVKDRQELELLSPLGCAFQTGSGTLTNALKASPEDVVVIMGLGGVGMSAVMGAKIQGCSQIVGIDRVASRLQLAKEIGCTHTIDTSALGDKSLVDAVREVVHGSGSTITVDTSGVPDLINAGVQFTRRHGKIVQVGSAPHDFDLKLTLTPFMLSGKQLIGVVEGDAHAPEYLPKMIQWYREGRFPIDKLVKRFPAKDFKQALKEMHDGSTIKPVLSWA